jgi:hypothetical protein
MLYKMLSLVVALAALIALPAGSAIAQLVVTPLPSAPDVSEFVETPEMMAAKERKQFHHNDDGVAILKCAEDNTQAGFQPLVLTFSATFDTPSQCEFQDRCVDCLKVLTQKLDCEGNDEFTSNVVFNKFVFECDLENDDDDDDDDDD